jgi:hypothetical protein
MPGGLANNDRGLGRFEVGQIEHDGIVSREQQECREKYGPIHRGHASVSSSHDSEA